MIVSARGRECAESDNQVSDCSQVFSTFEKNISARLESAGKANSCARRHALR